MSDPMTRVTTQHGGWLARGHVTRQAAIAETRRYWEQQLHEAQQTLADLDSGNVQVFHQRGIYVARNCKELTANG